MIGCTLKVDLSSEAVVSVDCVYNYNHKVIDGGRIVWKYTDVDKT